MKLVYLIAITMSVLLSAWINTHESVINVDAICYVLSAEALGQFDLSGAMHVCPQAKWPFYSLLIYALSKITTVSYVTSAYLLDGFFSAISVVTFVAIVSVLSQSRRLVWFALLVVLLSHQFNSVREYIVRDHGFWTFYLVSVYFLLQYVDGFKKKYALVWSASLLAATLFRIEGAIFLLVLPFIVWCFPAISLRRRWSHFLMLYAPMLVLAAGIVAWLALHPQQSLEKLGRVHEVINQAQHGIALMAERYHDTKQALLQHVLSSDAARDAGLMLILMVCVWYLINVFGNLSWIYSALVFYAWTTQAAKLKRSHSLVLSAYLIINLCVTFAFFAQHLFLAKRYLIAFSLVLMLWVPFALERLWVQAAHLRAARIGLATTAIAILITSLGGIFHFGYSKSYIHDAGTWIANNVPENASIYLNDYQLMYYSKHYRQDFFNTATRYTHTDTLSNGQWKQYDYLALRIGKHDYDKNLAVLQELRTSPTKEFTNERGDKIVIYNVTLETKQ